ncbi:MAG: hypothetical protein ACI86H_002143 [bacterium]|jgi:hypothetical protein
MKTLFIKNFILFVLFLAISSASFAATKQTTDVGNLYSRWIQLSLGGKSQSEIEYFFRGINDKSLKKVKARLRFAVIANLKRKGVHQILAQSTDTDDLNVAKQKIRTEIRFMGMEHDTKLKLSIKDEFGLALNSF